MSKAKALVGRQELLDWLNNLLSLNYTKVEETANGAAFCQVLDAINVGSVSLGRVNFNAYSEPDIFENYKILQESFDKNGIEQYIDVASLSKGGYMAALEMFQFLYGYYQSHDPGNSYDAIARRKQCHCREPRQSTSRGAAGSSGRSIRRTVPQKQFIPKSTNSQKIQKPKTAIPSEVSNQAGSSHEIQTKPPARSTATALSSSDSSSLKAELKRKNKEIQNLKEEVEQMCQEKEFYFGKLRRIEDFCQDMEEEEDGGARQYLHDILQILYEQDPENGFVTPEEEEEA